MGRYLRKLNRRAGDAPGTGGEAPGVAARVAELRRLTIESRELSEPIQYFQKELAVFASFMKLGEIGRDPLLEDALREASQRAVPDLELTSPRMIHVSEHRLWHGAAQASRGGVAMFFYFDDIGVGVAHLVPALRTGQNHYLRFTGAQRG